jgi:hypothetical protein
VINVFADGRVGVVASDAAQACEGNVDTSKRHVHEQESKTAAAAHVAALDPNHMSVSTGSPDRETRKMVDVPRGNGGVVEGSQIS